MKRLVVLLAPALVFAGQSLQTASGHAQNNSFPNIGHTTPVRLELYLHDWAVMPTTNFITGDSIGISANLYNVSGKMQLAIWTPWGSGGTVINLDALFPTTKAVYIRVQRDVASQQLDIELWDISGNQVYGRQFALGADVPDTGTGISVGCLYGPCDIGFFRVHSTLVSMNSRPPVTADNTNTLLNWAFGGTLLDSSGKGYTANLPSGSAVYVSTPYQNVVAKVKTMNAPPWSDWVSLRAGKPNQLDGTASYSQADGSAAVTYTWSEVPQGSRPKLIWDNYHSATPTVTGAVFGTYTIQLTVTDSSGHSASSTLVVGAVGTDDNGVVVNADPNADTIFGPMIAFGKNPWGYADYLSLKATTQRLSDYQDYGLSPTWPYASWEANQPGTVTYNWGGTGMDTYASAPGTTITGPIPASGIAFQISLADPSKIDVSELPTRVYLWTTRGSFEEIRICSLNAGKLVPCYDGRGWADPSNGRILAQAWPSGTKIGQFKVKGTGTTFLTTLCEGGTQSPVGLVAYSAGKVTVTAGSPNIVGVGTAWATPPVYAAYKIRVSAAHGGQAFIFEASVRTITDGTHITLSRPFPADADSGAYSYKIIATDQGYVMAREPVLHYTRLDGSEAMEYWPSAYGCESDTALYLRSAWDNVVNGRLQSNTTYSYMDGDWWINQGSRGGLNFYGEDLAHRALYLRSGYAPALTAANMIGDMWVRMPMISGHSSGSPLFSGGLAIGGFADAMLSTSAHKTSWSDLRGFASQAVTVLGKSCSAGGDSRDTGYQLAWIALAALFDPDTTSTKAPGGIPWRTYWRNQLAPMYTRELTCKGSDNSWASGFNWNSRGDQITFTNGSAVGSGVNISANTCAGVTSGTGAATNGSGIITGTGFVAVGTNYRIAITGTKLGRPFTMWQYYSYESPTRVALTQGAAWQGDSGPITWVIDSTNYFLTFMRSNDDSMGAETWSCIKNSPSQITLNRPWDGPSGTYGAYSSNVVGISQMPYMLGIRQAAWRWAALAATDMGNSALAANFNGLRYAAGTWVRSTGFDSLVTHGMYYAVQAGCVPITPASMGYAGGGPCFDASPSNSDYDKVAMRELTAENSSSMWSYSDANSGSSASVAWGDLAYGSLWGYLPSTTGSVYTPPDQLTEQNPAYGASYGLSAGKWTGFFFGMGMAHQWPAVRLGGVAPESLVSLPVAFDLSIHPSAVGVKVTVTQPSGATKDYSCSSSPCLVQVDMRQGSHWSQVTYLSASGTVVSQDLPQLITAPGLPAHTR